MSRRVRRRVATEGEDDTLSSGKNGALDWIRLPDDTVIQIFSCLNYRDRASLSSTCKPLWALGRAPCLWKDLDLRSHKFSWKAASSLSTRCEKLEKIRFRGHESAEAVINLRSKNLRYIAGDCCAKLTDATLCALAGRHVSLQSLQIGPSFCGRISSDAIKTVTMCCPNLQKLRLSGVCGLDAHAINALAEHCIYLSDIGFINSVRVDEAALGNVKSLRFLSVAGSAAVKWATTAQHWAKLPHLVGLDVSRTAVSSTQLCDLYSSLQNLKVLCALNCQEVKTDSTFVSRFNHKGKVLLSDVTDILKVLANLFIDSSEDDFNVFLRWRDLTVKDEKLDGMLNWLEWVISCSLWHMSLRNPPGLEDFWLSQGTNLLLSFIQSSDEEVQEQTATSLASFVVADNENASIYAERAQAVIRQGGIRILLNLARSWRERLQSKAAEAIASLSVNANIAKAVINGGGIGILTNLARSTNRLLAEEAAGGLWNLSVDDQHKGLVAEAGGVKALVDLIFRWSGSSDGDEVLERSAGALANLAADVNCSTVISSVCGIKALAMLAKTCKIEVVQGQAARALANLANWTAVGHEEGVIKALVKLIQSSNDGVRQEAADALWNLSVDEENREAIAAASGVEVLVALAKTCSNAPHGLQKRAAGALWGLSASEAYSIAIGQEGGVAPLIALARSSVEDVHETAAAALWSLAYNPGNALRIVEQDGISALGHLCSSSASKMARFVSALALTYMLDGRVEETALIGKGARRMALRLVESFVMSFSDPKAFSAAAASSASAALSQVAASACVGVAGHLRCSRLEIGRFIAMLRNPSSVYCIGRMPRGAPCEAFARCWRIASASCNCCVCFCTARSEGLRSNSAQKLGAEESQLRKKEQNRNKVSETAYII